MDDFYIFVDDPASFDDLANLQVGDVYYEEFYGMIVKAIVSSPVTEDTYEGKRRINWSSEVWAIDPKTGNPQGSYAPIQPYTIIKGLESYGPSCFKRLVKLDRDYNKKV